MGAKVHSERDYQEMIRKTTARLLGGIA